MVRKKEDTVVFEQFKKNIRVWQAKLNMLDWDVLVLLEDCAGTDNAGCFAYITMSPEDMNATVVLNKEHMHDPEFNSNSTALHELLHAKLNKLKHLVLDERAVWCSSINSEEHSVIKSLMYCILGGPKFK